MIQLLSSNLRNTCGSGILHRDTTKGYAGEQGARRRHHWVVIGDSFDRSVLCLAAIVAVLLCGCKSEARKAQTADRPLLSRLPGDLVQQKKPVPSVGQLPAPQETRITISWENEPSAYASNYVTRVEAAPGLEGWQEVAAVPYSTAGAITLTIQAPMMTFRVCNAIK